MWERDPSDSDHPVTMAFITLQLSRRIHVCTVDHLLRVGRVVQLCDLIVPRLICSLQMCWRFRHLRRLPGLAAGKMLLQFSVIGGGGSGPRAGSDCGDGGGENSGGCGSFIWKSV